MTFNTNNYQKTNQYIEKSIENISNLPISIIAITKTQSVETIKEAISAGVRLFGENRVQEAFDKFQDLKTYHKDLKLHMVGALQTNKVKKSLLIFDCFHTLDRESLANEFVKYYEIASSKNFFIQVNTGHEKQKSGIAPNRVEEFVKYCIYDLKLNILGLMCLPPIFEDPQHHFLKLKDLASKNNLKHLSMGMSHDYKTAVKCGATFIRIGTFFFGERK